MMWRKRTRAFAPDEDCVARSTKFRCQIDRAADGHNGAVQDEQCIIRWRYGIRNNASGRSTENPFNKPDFVIAGPDAEDEVIIRMASFIPTVIGAICAWLLIRRESPVCPRLRLRDEIDQQDGFLQNLLGFENHATRRRSWALEVESQAE